MAMNACRTKVLPPRSRSGRKGVFATRSPHRPNPLGLHEVQVTAVEGSRIRVRSLEVIDGTPIVDVKPVLSADIARR